MNLSEIIYVKHLGFRRSVIKARALPPPDYLVLFPSARDALVKGRLLCHLPVNLMMKSNFHQNNGNVPLECLGHRNNNVVKIKLRLLAEGRG